MNLVPKPAVNPQAELTFDEVIADPEARTRLGIALERFSFFWTLTVVALLGALALAPLFWPM